MPLLNAADAVYLGDTPADAVYLGADRVWPSATFLLQGGGSAACSLVPPVIGGFTRSVGRTWMALPGALNCSYQDTVDWLTGFNTVLTPFTSMTLVDQNGDQLTLNAGDMTRNNNSIVSTVLHDWLDGAPTPIRVYLPEGAPRYVSLDEAITDLIPFMYWRLDEAAFPLVDRGSWFRDKPLTLGTDGLFQVPIGTGSLVGVGSGAGATSFNENSGGYYSPETDTPQCTIVNFFDGDPGANEIGYSPWSGSFKVLRSLRDTVTIDTGGYVASPPAGTDYSGLWMRAITVENAGNLTAWDNAVAGTPVAIGPKWATRDTYQWVKAASTCTVTHVAIFDKILTQAQLQGLSDRFQIEGA
jgi:hypothetical protein